MRKIVGNHQKLFSGLGKATGVEPVHIEIDKTVPPVQQKRQSIPLHYVDRFKAHLEELIKEGVVEGPLDYKSATGWIHNPVISDKKYGGRIRLNLDTRPMAKAVKTSHFPIPTPQELRHEFAGSDRFSVLDMNHAFHQFMMDEETQELYVFYTPWGLYKFQTLVMGVSSASGETNERIRTILKGLKGVVQIKDDVVVHGKGKKHDDLLKETL